MLLPINLHFSTTVLVLVMVDSQRIIADMSFKTEIKALKIRQGTIVVQLSNKVFLVDLFKM